MCDVGRTLRAPQILRSSNKQCEKAQPLGSRTSRAYDVVQRRVGKGNLHTYTIQTLDELPQIVGW